MHFPPPSHIRTCSRIRACRILFAPLSWIRAMLSCWWGASLKSIRGPFFSLSLAKSPFLPLTLLWKGGGRASGGMIPTPISLSAWEVRGKWWGSRKDEKERRRRRSKSRKRKRVGECRGGWHDKKKRKKGERYQAARLGTQWTAKGEIGKEEKPASLYGQ